MDKRLLKGDVMKKSNKFLLVLSVGLLLQPLLYAKSHNRVSAGRVDKRLSIATRLSYGEGCIVGDCTNGYGYYMYSNGDAAIGKWVNDGDSPNGPGVSSRVDYFAAGNWNDDGVPEFGMTSWYNGFEYIGEFARADDGYWYSNGMGFGVKKGVYSYGSFVNASLVSDGCQIYYADTLRSAITSLPRNSINTRATCNEGSCTSGIGKETYDHGYYIGDFVDGKANGFGVYVNNNGEISAGRWVNHNFEEGYIYSPSANKEQAIMEVNGKYYVIERHGELSVYQNETYLGEYCSLNSGTQTPVSTATAIQKMLAGKSYGVDGLFFNYGSGPFDWIYVEKTGAYAAKLAGANSSGFFDWEFIHTSSDPAFQYINISSDGKTVKFGPLKESSLPGK